MVRYKITNYGATRKFPYKTDFYEIPRMGTRTVTDRKLADEFAKFPFVDVETIGQPSTVKAFKKSKKVEKKALKKVAKTKKKTAKKASKKVSRKASKKTTKTSKKSSKRKKNVTTVKKHKKIKRCKNKRR